MTKERLAHEPIPPEPRDDVAVTGHVYDGIEEYDNPLPGWWTALFYITIIFSIGYAFLYFAQPEWTNVRVAYQLDKERDIERQFAEIGELEPDRATLLDFITDPEKEKWLTFGKTLFAANCVSCHGREGEGVSAPNMTDDAYLHVKTIEDIADVVANGAKAGAMPAWGTRLGQNEVVLVSAYVASLRGNNVGGKGREGTSIPEWEDAVAPEAEETEAGN